MHEFHGMVVNVHIDGLIRSTPPPPGWGRGGGGGRVRGNLGKIWRRRRGTGYGLERAYLVVRTSSIVLVAARMIEIRRTVLALLLMASETVRHQPLCGCSDSGGSGFPGVSRWFMGLPSLAVTVLRGRGLPTLPR